MGLRITFVLPQMSLSGGNKVTLTYADGLAARGHDVSVVHGQLTRLKDRISAWSFRRGADVHRPGSKVRILPVRGVPTDLTSFLPDADILIASWWETMEAVSMAPPSKGVKIHHVQDHEVFPYLPTRSAAVYRLPIPKIAVSRWLADLMRDTYGSNEVSLVVNPVDIGRFPWTGRTRAEAPMVGTVFSAASRKNSAMAFEAVEIARKRIPDLKLLCFGAERLPKAFAKLPFVEFHHKPAQEAIPDLYRRCNAWLFTSESEGFGLPILEAMAVGTPVIATHAGAAPDLVSARTGVLVGLNPGDMADAICRLFTLSEAEWRAMGRNCRAVAERHDVNSAVEQFEAVLLNHGRRP